MGAEAERVTSLFVADDTYLPQTRVDDTNKLLVISLYLGTYVRRWPSG